MSSQERYTPGAIFLGITGIKHGFTSAKTAGLEP